MDEQLDDKHSVRLAILQGAMKDLEEELHDAKAQLTATRQLNDQLIERYTRDIATAIREKELANEDARYQREWVKVLSSNVDRQKQLARHERRQLRDQIHQQDIMIQCLQADTKILSAEKELLSSELQRLKNDAELQAECFARQLADMKDDAEKEVHCLKQQHKEEMENHNADARQRYCLELHKMWEEIETLKICTAKVTNERDSLKAQLAAHAAKVAVKTTSMHEVIHEISPEGQFWKVVLRVGTLLLPLGTWDEKDEAELVLAKALYRLFGMTPEHSQFTARIKEKLDRISVLEFFSRVRKREKASESWRLVSPP